MKIENVEVIETRIVQVPHVYRIVWRWAPGNDEIWLNKISKIMDMNFIPIKKHEMEIW